MLCRRRMQRQRPRRRPFSVDPAERAHCEHRSSDPDDKSPSIAAEAFCRRCHRRGKLRSGVAAVEMAVLLPLLIFFFVLGVDFARIYYFSLTVTNAAKNGALHAADVDHSPYDSIEEAVLSDAQNLTPTPTVKVDRGRGASGQLYTEVTVEYEFRTVTNYLKVTTPITLVRTIRAPVLPTEPNF